MTQKMIMGACQRDMIDGQMLGAGGGGETRLQSWYSGSRPAQLVYISQVSERWNQTPEHQNEKQQEQHQVRVHADKREKVNQGEWNMKETSLL